MAGEDSVKLELGSISQPRAALGLERAHRSKEAGPRAGRGHSRQASQGREMAAGERTQSIGYNFGPGFHLGVS